MTLKEFETAMLLSFVILGGFIMVYPLLWLVMSSFKDNSEIFDNAQV